MAAEAAPAEFGLRAKRQPWLTPVRPIERAGYYLSYPLVKKRSIVAVQMQPEKGKRD